MKFWFHSRSTPRAAAGWLAALICFAAVLITYAWWQGSATGRELAAARLDHAALERRLNGAEGKLRKERERLAVTDADNERLIDAIASGAIPNVAAARLRLTPEEIAKRYQRGQALEATGDASGALAEYLWCFDIGARPHDLLQRIARLSETFSPARQAMADRRERAEARVLANPDDVETMGDMIALNRALDDDSRTLRIYDRLPVGDARRTHRDRSMLEVFLLNRRYADAMRVLPYEQLKQGLQRAAGSGATQAAKDRQAKAQQEIIRASGGSEAQQAMQRLAIQRAREAQRKAIVQECAVGVEILAGAGELPKALEIAREVLAIDGSMETRALLQEHAARAGHAELLQGLSR